MDKDSFRIDRVGSKRYKRDFESDESSVPSVARFNFFVAKKQNERLFDPETVAQIESASNLSANVLNRRFSQRSKDNREHDYQLATVKKEEISRIQSEPGFIKHQALSYSIMAYLHLIFNTILIGIILYVLLNVILILRQYLTIKEKEHMDALHQGKMLCTRNYVENRCGDIDRVPAIEGLCNEWAACMQKDMVVARAKVSAEAFGEILSSFVEPISYKALFFFTLLIVGSLVTSNMSINLSNRKRRAIE